MIVVLMTWHIKIYTTHKNRCVHVMLSQTYRWDENHYVMDSLLSILRLFGVDNICSYTVPFRSWPVVERQFVNIGYGNFFFLIYLLLGYGIVFSMFDDIVVSDPRFIPVKHYSIGTSPLLNCMEGQS